MNHAKQIIYDLDVKLNGNLLVLFESCLSGGLNIYVGTLSLTWEGPHDNPVLTQLVFCYKY